jgi:hypothetical protein
LTDAGAGKTEALAPPSGSATFTNDSVVSPAAANEIWFVSAKGNFFTSGAGVNDFDNIFISLQQTSGNLNTINSVTQSYYGAQLSGGCWAFSGYLKTTDTTNFVVYITWLFAGATSAGVECNGFTATRIS